MEAISSQAQEPLPTTQSMGKYALILFLSGVAIVFFCGILAAMLSASPTYSVLGFFVLIAVFSAPWVGSLIILPIIVGGLLLNLYFAFFKKPAQERAKINKFVWTCVWVLLCCLSAIAMFGIAAAS